MIGRTENWIRKIMRMDGRVGGNKGGNAGGCEKLIVVKG